MDRPHISTQFDIFDYSHRLPGMVSPSVPKKPALLRFDGGSRGNPGIAGCGYVITIYPNTTREERIVGGLYLGDQITNNYAEYTGLIEGLRRASSNKVTDIFIEGDSMLVIKQVSGKWKVSSQNIMPLYEEAKSLLETFYHYELLHISRNNNKEADELANLAMDYPHIYSSGRG